MNTTNQQARRVMTAQPYDPSEMGSLGRAAGMLMMQHRFPDTYDERDKLTCADHDRVMSWDYEHARDTIKRHTGTGELGIGNWVKNAQPNRVLRFLIELLKADTSVGWNGWRVLGTVHRGNGYPVFTLQLFAKHPLSNTEVYSGPIAPNVKGGGEDDFAPYR